MIVELDKVFYYSEASVLSSCTIKAWNTSADSEGIG